MNNKLVALLLGACLSVGVVGINSPAQAAICMVTDPTGTPLNVRRTPNGRIIGSVESGLHVNVIGTAKDAQGRRWAKIRAESGAVGWVLREFVSCA
jgi:uncharacterized protein YgiM (DUF1202 family)